MKKCPNCNSKLSTQAILKSYWSFKSYPEITCSACGETLKHQTSNRILGGLTIGIAAVFMMSTVDTFTQYTVFNYIFLDF